MREPHDPCACVVYYNNTFSCSVWSRTVTLWCTLLQFFFLGYIDMGAGIICDLRSFFVFFLLWSSPINASLHEVSFSSLTCTLLSMHTPKHSTNVTRTQSKASNYVLRSVMENKPMMFQRSASVVLMVFQRVIMQIFVLRRPAYRDRKLLILFHDVNEKATHSMCQ